MGEKAKSTTKSMRPAKSQKKQNETAPVSSLPSRKKAKPAARPTNPPMRQNRITSRSVKPAQAGYNSPVSSSASVAQRNAGKDEAKLSKAQKARLRKRMAKERKKEAQKFYKI